jgi:catechol 2,3-dioxygenase-like lactoylglutathione lyase family enzyme
MQRLIRVTRVYLKHAAIVLALGLFSSFATYYSDAQDRPKRPRITGIAAVRLYVSNIGKSVDFYTQHFGLPASGGGCAHSAVPCFPVNAQQQIELYPASNPAPRNWLAEIILATDDLPAMRRYLIAHGLNPKEIHSSPDSPAHLQVNDPEGNPVGFASPTALADYKTSPNQLSSRLLHAGFVVKDVAAENKFYLDLLGFKLYWRGGFKDDGLDWYEIQVPDGDNWIEYMLNIPANADHKELGVQNHFSLGAKDIHAAVDQLHKNGLLKLDGPEIGRDGKWGLDAYDPDGTRVEVMEFTPAGKPCCHPYAAPHPTP